MKKIEISKKDYNTIKEIIKTSSCMARAYNTVQTQFIVETYQAHIITNAVYYDYKYLKIIE